ncbi:MAG: S-adenosylmethionine:tRNA ribosyltransferase-isomerase [Bacteroidetes bacterium]|nr:S-adenosylmethionine:tRNA ribosyltransferase-isomerase [Bacteroidota bacterium]
MKDPRNISIRDFTYSLPEQRIAGYPLAERDASKLLIYKEGLITEDLYRNISNYIPENSLLVFNDTKVVEARLLFQKPTGGVIEIFCLEPHEQYPDITTAMLQTCLPAGKEEKVWWHCLVGGASKWKHGQVLEKRITQEGYEIVLQGKYVEKKQDSFIIELSWHPVHLSFAEILHYAGAVPLPPYIRRAVEESDRERYQTVYAHFEGSVAAPTAGLHFTEKIFNALKSRKIKTEFVTLHVGAGTFKPVKNETMAEHEMHAEWIDVRRSSIETILNSLDRDIIAVGTTSLRTIESLYWMGVKSLESSADSQESIYLSQWDVYDLNKGNISVKDALQALLERMAENNLERLVAKTQILIAPGYSFKIVKGLITNFHQPQSTLLLLIASFIGENLPTGQAGWKKVYDYALQNDFRFLSYGDGSLLWRSTG